MIDIISKKTNFIGTKTIFNNSIFKTKINRLPFVNIYKLCIIFLL